MPPMANWPIGRLANEISFIFQHPRHQRACIMTWPAAYEIRKAATACGCPLLMTRRWGGGRTIRTMMMPCQQARDTRRQLPSRDLASKNCGLRPPKNSAVARQTTQIESAWRIFILMPKNVIKPRAANCDRVNWTPPICDWDWKRISFKS